MQLQREKKTSSFFSRFTCCLHKGETRACVFVAEELQFIENIPRATCDLKGACRVSALIIKLFCKAAINSGAHVNYGM